MRQPGARGGKGWQTAAKAAISCALLVFLFREIPFGEVWRALRAMQPVWVAGALGLAGAMHGLAATQMRRVLHTQGIDLSLGRVFGINMIAKFYGLVLPGYAAGGLLRWYRFSRDNRMRTEAAAAILFNRSLELSILAGVGVAGWTLSDGDRLGLVPSCLVYGVAAVPMLVLLSLLHPRLFRLVSVPMGAWSRPPWLGTRIRKLLTSLALFQGRGAVELAVLTALSLGRLSCTLASFYALGRALGVDISLLVLAWLRLLMDLVLMLPLSLSGLGVREVSFAYLLGPLGIPGTTAVALALSLYFRGLVFAALGGVLEARRSWFRPHRGPDAPARP